MREALSKLMRRSAVRQFIKFSIVGASNTLIDLGGYVILTRAFGVYFIAANICSWLIAVCSSFVLNKYWTFRTHEPARVLNQYLKFFIVSVGALMLSTLILHILVTRWSISDLFAKGITIAFVVVWNFGMNKRWTFRT